MSPFEATTATLLGYNNCPSRFPTCIQANCTYKQIVLILKLQLQQISHLAKLELEVALLVKDLDAVVVGVRHHDLIVRGDCHPTWLSELPSQDAKLAKLAVVDHLLALDVRLGRIDYGRGWNWRSNTREIICGAGGEALQGQVAHAQQVKRACHVVVLQIVQVIKAQCLVVATSLKTAL